MSNKNLTCSIEYFLSDDERHLNNHGSNSFGVAIFAAQKQLKYGGSIIAVRDIGTQYLMTDMLRDYALDRAANYDATSF